MNILKLKCLHDQMRKVTEIRKGFEPKDLDSGVMSTGMIIKVTNLNDTARGEYVDKI